ncbi:MAG: hypothetical protein WCK63_16495 [Betaproteobacteria bacterium]
MSEADHQATESSLLPALPGQPIPRKTRDRPDGTDIGRYRGYENWAYHRWAWEFLRRNEKFIEACSTISTESSEKKKLEIANQFGLKKYKSWKEGYRAASNKPIFSIVSISSWSNIDTEPQEEQFAEIDLKSGQVLIRFDVASAIGNPMILDEQLRKAAIRLRKQLAAFKTLLGIQLPPHRSRVSKFLEFLRVLDCSASGKTQFECELVVNPYKLEEFKKNKKKTGPIQQAGHKKVKQATKYTTDLYRFLAVRRGSPSIDSIPNNHLAA